MTGSGGARHESSIHRRRGNAGDVWVVFVFGVALAKNLVARHISFQFLFSFNLLSKLEIIFIKPLVRRQTGKNQSQLRNPVEAVCNLLNMYYYILL